VTWHLTVYIPLPNFEIVKDETYLEIGGQRCDPGSYEVPKGGMGTFVITARNIGEVSGECKARVRDDNGEVLVESDPVEISVGQMYTFRLNITFDRDRSLKVEVLRRDPQNPDQWQVVDSYGD